MTTNSQTLTAVPDNLNGSQGDAPGAPPSAIITRDGARVLRVELGRVRFELEVGTVMRLREARVFGAPAGNDEYLQIQEEEIVLAARAARLEELLDRAQVIDSDSHDGKAAVGTVVDVRDTQSGELKEHELVGGHETPRAGTASAASPIGQALIGRTAGSIVDVDLPKGGSQSLEILHVRRANLALL